MKTNKKPSKFRYLATITGGRAGGTKTYRAGWSSKSPDAAYEQALRKTMWPGDRIRLFDMRSGQELKGQPEKKGGK
jgi:hypothetical protein